VDGLTPGKRVLGPASCLIEESKVVRRNLRDGLREVSFVVVEPEYRGQGYGRALLDAITLEADECGAVLFVNVDPYDDSPLDREALRKWYERFGFTEFQSEPLLMARTPVRIASDMRRRIAVAH
jgi:GNAT superfamily N-acetyltransferase